MMIRRKKGFSLIEITVVIFLFSIVLAALFSVLATARVSSGSGGSNVTVQQEARKGLNAMVKELRQASLVTISGVPADGIDYNSITFNIPTAITASGTTWSSNIQYVKGGLENSQLIRVQDGNQRVIANNISSLLFNRNTSAPDVLNVAISVQKNTFPGFSAIQSTISLNSEVKIRND